MIRQIFKFDNKGLQRLAIIIALVSVIFAIYNLWGGRNEDLVSKYSLIYHLFVNYIQESAVSRAIFLNLFAWEAGLIPYFILRLLDWVIVGFKSK